MTGSTSPWPPVPTACIWGPGIFQSPKPVGWQGVELLIGSSAHDHRGSRCRHPFRLLILCGLGTMYHQRDQAGMRSERTDVPGSPFIAAPSRDAASGDRWHRRHPGGGAGGYWGAGAWRFPARSALRRIPSPRPGRSIGSISGEGTAEPMTVSEIELTFLGTGTSSGVPVIGCHCETCTSEDPRDRRLRCGACLRFTDPTGSDPGDPHRRSARPPGTVASRGDRAL